MKYCDISNLNPGTLVVMQTYYYRGEYHSTGNKDRPVCLFFIVKKMYLSGICQRYMTCQGIVCLFQRNFDDSDVNKVMLETGIM